MRDDAVDRLGDALVERGWQWWSDAGQETPSLVRDRPNDLVNLVGLMTQQLSGERVSVSPTLGMTHVEVSRLNAAFNGRPWRGAGDSSSFGTTLQGLLHGAGFSVASHTRWVVDSPSDVERVVGVILADLETYGQPWWDGFSDLGDIISWLQADKGYQALVGNLAIALALTGATEEAAKALADYSAFTAQHGGRMHDRTLTFVMAFSDHFGISAQT